MTDSQSALSPFKLIVAGSRYFNDLELCWSFVVKCLRDRLPNAAIVCGEAKGADTLGKVVGKKLGLEILSFPASWDERGKAAGYIRNVEMAKVADGVLVFWDGKSTGTKHMIDIATKHELPLVVVRYDLLQNKLINNKEVVRIYGKNNRHTSHDAAA